MISSSLLEIGSKFGDYTVVKLLGKGGMGEVYLVEKDGINYALKLLSNKIAKESPVYIKRFLREANIAMRIRQENLVAVHAFGKDDASSLYYIVMDYVSGCDLRSVIALGGAMEPDEAVRIILSVARALAAAESLGVVHRDIKPENIMIEDNGTVKLVDLGVAKARGTDSLSTMPRTVFGTPNYISPEQAQDASRVNFRADVYSMGVVLYELLTGKRPYECDKPKEVLAKLLSPEELPDVREIRPEVPAKISAVLKLMLAKDPEKRIASASKLLEVFSRVGYDVSNNVEAGRYPKKSAEPEFKYSAYDSTVSNNTLSFDTQDEEIKSFVNAIKARRRREKILRVAAVALGVVLVLLIIFKFVI